MGQTVRLGRPRWVAEIAGSGTEDLTGVAFAVEGQKAVTFELEDALRPGAKAAADQLSADGLKLQIISGDQTSTVSSIAARLGISSFAAEMTPKQKIQHVQELQQAGNRVLMVGDGLNDAPALAAAHVSMAPASASDVGRLASDFVFTRPELHAVVSARAIALKTGRLVRQNFGLAIAYNCVAVPLAMAGLITPLLAAIAMSTSSIVVIANSMRLNLHRDDFAQAEKPARTKTKDTSNSAVTNPVTTGRAAA